MCEVCHQDAQINALNAQAIESMAKAAKDLALNVAGSEKAIQAILGRIEAIGGEQKEVPSQESELPEELHQLFDALKGFGMDVQVVRVPK